MRVLFTGVTSIHGWYLFKHFSEKLSENQVFGIRSPKMSEPHRKNIIPCCITDRLLLAEVKKQFNPTHIVHCAGVCDLDVCEERPGWAHSMNTEGSQIIADTFGNTCTVLYMSADLIFSGNDTPVGGYDENATVNPVSVAGKTIAAAEQEIMKCKEYLIVRLGLPIGKSVTGDKGAADFIASRLRRKLPITLFHDEWRSCLSCQDLSNAIYEMILSDIRGIFHLGGPQKVSLYEIGEWVLRKGNYAPSLLNGILRSQEIGGPPRMGDVSLNSSKISNLLSFEIKNPLI
jgi:dTDP-4-dehydrorhamnose reductase